MSGNFRNLIHVLRRYKAATAANLAGLCLAFTAFFIVEIHVRYEYGFDSSISGREYIFQVENLRGDGIWEPNWARPQIEKFVSSSPVIESAGIYNGLAYFFQKVGFSPAGAPGSPVVTLSIERIRPGFIDTFGFEFTSGNADNFPQFGTVLIPASLARQLYGDEDPIGKQLFTNEFRDLPASGTRGGREVITVSGLEISSQFTVGGVYRDFPENTRLGNAVYTLIPEHEQMNDWYTGSYYCFVKLSSPSVADSLARRYMAENADRLANDFDIHDIRLRPLDGLYFTPSARADHGPRGNKTGTDMLRLLGILVIVIALVNYINFSVALAPVRIKSINTRKVLGCSQASLRTNLVCESLGITVIAFLLACLLTIVLQNGVFLPNLLGHGFHLQRNPGIVLLTAVIAVGAGIAAGTYPAFYMTSFPPAMAVNGSFAATGRAKATRVILVGLQYVISMALVTSAVFIALQNRFLNNIEPGFDKDKVAEVRVGMGTALNKNGLLSDLLVAHPDIEQVAWSSTRFVSDQSQSLIGYFYRGEHYYMAWRGVSPNFSDVMGIEVIAGRNFRPGDQERDDDKAVAIINETAAREIISRFPGEITDISALIGTPLSDDGKPVEIIGISSDFHHQSLYRPVTPYGFWVSAPNRYRRTVPENFVYIKIGPGDPAPALEHIRQAVDKIDPGYPADIRLLDGIMEDFYLKAHAQESMVALFSLLAVIISLVGVFGLVIFEGQRREREIALRKIFGSSIWDILKIFNAGFIRIVGICFVVSVPVSVYSVDKWLQNFAYKIPLHIWVFIAVLIAVTLVTVATVTFQSYRAATENPARKLNR